MERKISLMKRIFSLLLALLLLLFALASCDPDASGKDDGTGEDSNSGTESQDPSESGASGGLVSNENGIELPPIQI